VCILLVLNTEVHNELSIVMWKVKTVACSYITVFPGP